METACDRCLTTFVFILFLTLRLQIMAEKQYIFVQENKTWEEAIHFCQMHGGILSDVSSDDLVSIQNCTQNVQELWTSSYTVASPYLSLIGCYRTTETLEFFDLQTTSVVDCQHTCSNSTYFAIKERACSCIDYITSIEESVDARLCNITCEGTFCGGRNVSNVYSVVEEEFFTNRKITKSKDFTSCVSYQCSNNTFLYSEKDCSDVRVTQATCSSFFSCTFEPGDPCFLVQSENNDFNWTITKENTPHGPELAYEGSYFAFVNDSDEVHEKGSQASLVSNIDFFDIGDSIWCLRFRFSRRNTSTTVNVKIYTENMNDGSVHVYNKTFSGGLYVEWKYEQIDIKLHRHDRILFNFTRRETVSNFALDDVTLTKGTCEKTATQTLYMKGEVKCDFEGNQDTCFDQDKGDNFDWIIIPNGKTPRYPSTGPEKNIQGNYFSFIDANTDRQKGHKAVLISKFEFNNVNITFSMYYNMNGIHVNTLKVYLKKNDKEDLIMEKKGNQRLDWKFFNRTVDVNGTTKLYISANVGNGTLGNIAIDDIRIKLNAPDIKYNWMNLNKRCQRRLGVYTINHVQLPNLHCLSEGPERWTAIIRPQRRGTATRALQKQPSAVKLYRNVGSPYVYVWKEFSTSVSRPFVCEKNSARAHCLLYTEELTTNISGTSTELSNVEAGTSTELPNSEAGISTEKSNDMVVLVCLLTLGVAVALVVILYIRKRSSRRNNQDNGSSPPRTNAMYAHSSETIGIESTTPYDEISNIKPMGQDDKVTVSPQKTFSIDGKAYDSPAEYQKNEKELDEDYDHLHDSKTQNTSAMSDDVYSHVKESQNTPPLLADDTYDHTIMTEGEYGKQELYHDGNETYDHTHAPDEMYSLLHQDTKSAENVYEDAGT